VLEKNPNDADLVFNLGVIGNAKDVANAEKYYLRTMEIDLNMLMLTLTLQL
jgi:hypothetical protein